MPDWRDPLPDLPLPPNGSDSAIRRKSQPVVGRPLATPRMSPGVIAVTGTRRQRSSPRTSWRTILAHMQQASRRDRVIEAISRSSVPLDDDQLASRTGISPRQSVNQICRELERAELVRRTSGPDGKIVNEWLGKDDRPSDTAPVTAGANQGKAVAADATIIESEHNLPAGSSKEQRDAERIMLDLLASSWVRS